MIITACGAFCGWPTEIDKFPKHSWGEKTWLSVCALVLTAATFYQADEAENTTICRCEWNGSMGEQEFQTMCVIFKRKKRKKGKSSEVCELHWNRHPVGSELFRCFAFCQPQEKITRVALESQSWQRFRDGSDTEEGKGRFGGLVSFLSQMFRIV